MKSSINRSAALLAVMIMVMTLLSFAADKQQTYTGTVSDTMCGAKHAMGGNPADCTRACVKRGSKYALVIGDKVYALEGGDAATLDKLAGEKATVKGTAQGNTIEVASVAPAS